MDQLDRLQRIQEGHKQINDLLYLEHSKAATHFPASSPSSLGPSHPTLQEHVSVVLIMPPRPA